MSAEGDVTYVDSSAIVKLVVSEPESAALRRDLARRRELVTSALARTEVARALLALGPEAQRRGEAVLRTMQVMRMNDRVLGDAGRLAPVELRSLDAIHLASARQLGATLKRIVTYDTRMAQAARELGFSVVSPV
ncbi:MAG TPA: type II toxin-antitoxin system VapC family toxin [Solirubrobacteraceae bacterium]|nr:type II toxin-antitoxin system VapC family toxin [Solirubrobacteraceae bacterium]